jgi:hypothetical protein
MMKATMPGTLEGILGGYRKSLEQSGRKPLCHLADKPQVGLLGGLGGRMRRREGQPLRQALGAVACGCQWRGWHWAFCACIGPRHPVGVQH